MQKNKLGVANNITIWTIIAILVIIVIYLFARSLLTSKYLPTPQLSPLGSGISGSGYQASCYDSDGGIQPFMGGYVSFGGAIYSDTCITAISGNYNTSLVYEYYCSTKSVSGATISQVQGQKIPCSYGCLETNSSIGSLGACLNKNPVNSTST